MLDEANLYQDFRTQVNEMNNLVGDKIRLIRKDPFRDSIGNVKAQAK